VPALAIRTHLGEPAKRGREYHLGRDRRADGAHEDDREVRTMAAAQPMSRSSASTLAGEARPLLIGLLAVQLFIGYEWLMSALSKILADDFAGSLGATLSDAAAGQAGWYKDFIDTVVVPNGPLFGSLVMAGELAVGIALVAASLVGMFRWGRLTLGQRRLLLGVMAVSSFVGAFMSLNFHLAMGATAPWVISPDPNDQGVDLDSLLVMLQLVVAFASLYLMRVRRPEA